MTQLSPLDSTEPPGIADLLGAVLPTWAKVGAYIDAGRLTHVDIHTDRVAPRETGRRSVKRPRSDEDSAQLPSFDCVSQRGGSAIDSCFHLVDVGI